MLRWSLLFVFAFFLVFHFYVSGCVLLSLSQHFHHIWWRNLSRYSHWSLNWCRDWRWCWLLLSCSSSIGCFVCCQAFAHHGQLLCTFHLQHSLRHSIVTWWWRSSTGLVIFVDIVFNELEHVSLSVHEAVFDFFDRFPESINCLLFDSRVEIGKTLLSSSFQDLLDADFKRFLKNILDVDHRLKTFMN